MCSPEVAAWLADADARVLPEEQRPPTPPKAIVHAEDAEWEKVGKLMFDREMVEPIEKADVFHAHGLGFHPS